MFRIRTVVLLAIAALTLGASLVPLQPASALDTSGAVIDDPACVENTLPANDDGSSSQVNLPFDINFYGTTYSTMWVNNNGNVTFDGPLSTYTPFGLLATNRAIIAPFFADVDTRGTGSQPVQYGYGATAYQGHAAVCVNWVNVGYFSGHADKLNSFQLLLVTRPDKGVGSFDIVFNYDQIQWETGDYSGGMNGYGGTSARVGFSSGAGTVGTATELPGSGVSRAFLDQNAGGDTDGAGLKWSKLSSDVLGRYVFSVRAGGVIGDTYVAIGDSYQSGEGAHDYLAGTDTDTNKCHRSANAYPELLVDRGVVRLDLDFVACSGAVMIDLLRDEDPEGDGVPYDEDAQINHLGADTRLVTIGIVGNDLKFSDTVKECVIRSLGKWVTSPVFSRSCSGEMDEEVTERIDDLQGGYVGDYLMSIYRLVRTKAPYARVVVVSYPRFFPVDGSGGIGGCATLRKSDQRWMNSKIVRADKEIGQIARAAGFEYVNMADVLDGHEQCTEEPGMNGILPQAQSSVAKPESFHPNALGHGLMADRIKEQLYAGPAPSFTIHRGETVTRTFLVRGGGLAVNVGWPGSDVVTTLTSPSGVVYTRSEPQGADHGNGPTYEYFQVDNPEQGEWTVSMYGVDVDPAGEPVTFDAYDVPIANEAPTAALSVTGSGRTFQFDAGGSTDSDGAITDFMWDFGDGATATGAHVEHTYAYDGSFAPVLEVVDDDGDSSFAQAATNIAASASLPTIFSGSDLQLTNELTATGDLAGVVADGNVECNSNVTVKGDLVASGDVHLTNRCTIDGDVHAGGQVLLDSAATIDGSIEAVGDVRVQSTVHIGGDVRTAGRLVYIDGSATSGATAQPVVGGSVEEATTVAAPDVSAPQQPVADTAAERVTWTSWLNTLAAANDAPNWSAGLTANPGCTLAPRASSVNSPTVTVETATVIDARSAQSGCPTVSIQDMTIGIGADVTILADSFDSTGTLTVTSTDGEHHTLRLVVPGQITGPTTAGAVRFSGATTTANGATLEVHTPGTIDVNGTSAIAGWLHGGTVSTSGTVTVAGRTS